MSDRFLGVYTSYGKLFDEENCGACTYLHEIMCIFYHYM